MPRRGPMPKSILSALAGVSLVSASAMSAKDRRCRLERGPREHRDHPPLLSGGARSGRCSSPLRTSSQRFSRQWRSTLGLPPAKPCSSQPWRLSPLQRVSRGEGLGAAAATRTREWLPACGQRVYLEQLLYGMGQLSDRAGVRPPVRIVVRGRVDRRTGCGVRARACPWTSYRSVEGRDSWRGGRPPGGRLSAAGPRCARRPRRSARPASRSRGRGSRRGSPGDRRRPGP